jgi:hypothetical protein
MGLRVTLVGCTMGRNNFPLNCDRPGFLSSGTGGLSSFKSRRIAAVEAGTQPRPHSLQRYKLHTAILNEHAYFILIQKPLYCICSEGFLGVYVNVGFLDVFDSEISRF